MYSIIFTVFLHLFTGPVIVECDTDYDCMTKNPHVEF